MAKSSFWDDLGNTLTRKAKGLSSRAENLYEIQKIRNKLSAQERMTEKLMMDIGKMIYTRYEQGEAVDGETGVICEEISQHMLEASFCPYCGAACPTAELEEKAADVIEQAEEELEEAAEAEVTEVPETEAEENAEATEAAADPEETVEASEVVAKTAEASETETSGSDPELEEERTEVGSAETEEPAADPENTETIEEKTE